MSNREILDNFLKEREAIKIVTFSTECRLSDVWIKRLRRGEASFSDRAIDLLNPMIEKYGGKQFLKK